MMGRGLLRNPALVQEIKGEGRLEKNSWLFMTRYARNMKKLHPEMKVLL